MTTTEVGDEIWHIELPLPPDHPRSVLVYAIRARDGGVHLIDAGWDSTPARKILGAALEALFGSIEVVRSVTVTHHHADHLGLAGWIRRTTGAVLALHRAEQLAVDQLASAGGSAPSTPLLADLGVPPAWHAVLSESVPERHMPIVADILLEDGDRLAIDGRDLRVLHTPGHTAGHLCLVDHAGRRIFTGDHVLPDIFGGIDLGGDLGADPLGTYLDSLRHLAAQLPSARDEWTAFPGHGRVFTGIDERCRAIRNRFLARTRETAAVIGASPGGSAWEVAQRIRWSRGWSELSGEAKLQAALQTRAHLRYLARGGSLT